MTRAPAHLVERLHACERLARLSDRMVKVGPFNLGVDAALAMLPVGGGLYTVGLGAWLVYNGWKCEASPATLARMGAYVGVDAVTAEVPVLGAVVDMLFPGHILAVRALRADLERRYGPIPPETSSRRPSWAGFADRFHRGAAARA